MLERKRVWVPLAALLALEVGFDVAVATGGDPPQREAAPSNAASVRPAVKRIGAVYPIQAVFYAYESESFTTDSHTWTDVPGATLTVPVPKRVPPNEALLFARFTAESLCRGSYGYCAVRILMNGREMSPASGANYAFDSTSENSGTETTVGDLYESHSLERVWPVNLGPGTYRFQVQARVLPFEGTPTSTQFSLDDWTFTVQGAWDYE